MITNVYNRIIAQPEQFMTFFTIINYKKFNLDKIKKNIGRCYYLLPIVSLFRPTTDRVTASPDTSTAFCRLYTVLHDQDNEDNIVVYTYFCLI